MRSSILYVSLLVCMNVNAQALNAFIFPEDCHEYPLIFTLDGFIHDKSVGFVQKKRSKKHLEKFIADSVGGFEHIISTRQKVRNYPIEKYKYEVRGTIIKNYIISPEANGYKKMATFQFIDRTEQKEYTSFCVPDHKKSRKLSQKSINGYQVAGVKSKIFFKSLRRIIINLKTLGIKETWSIERKEQVKYVKKQNNKKKIAAGSFVAFGLTALIVTLLIHQ